MNLSEHSDDGKEDKDSRLNFIPSETKIEKEMFKLTNFSFSTLIISHLL